jgi:uncharacterized membrane protein YtjA (UPF0391 family)
LSSERKNLGIDVHWTSRQWNWEITMLYWTLVFLVIALVAALFGFTGIYAAAAGIAKILFFVFLVLLILSLFASAFRGRPPVA